MRYIPLMAHTGCPGGLLGVWGGEIKLDNITPPPQSLAVYKNGCIYTELLVYYLASWHS